MEKVVTAVYQVPVMMQDARYVFRAELPIPPVVNRDPVNSMSVRLSLMVDRD